MVPLDHGGRLHQHDDAQRPRPDPQKPDSDWAVDREETGAAKRLATQDCELMMERSHLEDQIRAAAKPQASHAVSAEMIASMSATVPWNATNR